MQASVKINIPKSFSSTKIGISSLISPACQEQVEPGA
uniref:Uncharacterized protein n=1 Tax=Arundo donax TaxID=35708 RepID=A0A0A9BMQ9_ARUDO